MAPASAGAILPFRRLAANIVRRTTSSCIAGLHLLQGNFICVEAAIFRGVAQLVARDVWDVDAAGSNPVTPTNSGIHKAFEYQKSRF